MRRILALLLTAVLLLLAAGCSHLFDREVYEEEPFESAPEAVEAEDPGDGMISNYAALRRAISRLVSERAESAILQFQDYDGSLSGDISAACWEVKSSTPLGAFAVDYISYDLSRIVSYTQAEIHITYKRSESQMAALEAVGASSALRTRLDEALRQGESYLVLSLTAAGLTSDTVREAVERTYYADPAACPVLPAAQAALYPDTGVSRIAEITLDYGLDDETLRLRREELDAALADLIAAVSAEEPAEADPRSEEERAVERVRALCTYIASVCVWDESAGSTAWDALTQGAASGEGMALALLAGCKALDVDAGLIFGRLDGEPHVWNTVRIGGETYHTDVSRWSEGEDAVFLVGDETIRERYWWDTAGTGTSALAYGASGEPSEEGSAELSEPLLEN